MIKKLSIILCIAILTACSKDDYVPGIWVPDPNDPTEVMENRVEGRVNIAYVTYYGTSIPDPTYLTHISYSFAELYVKDNVYQKFALQGDLSRFEKIVALKSQNPRLKVVLSFTNSVSNSDNTKDGGFSAMAKTDEGRTKFANDCLAFCRKYNLDGIDIDWEFPGMTFGSNAFDATVDVDNYTFLMKKLREVLGTQYILSYAGYSDNVKATTGGKKYIDIAAVDPYVDYVNIMTYDLCSAPQHQSAINVPSYYWDCKRSVDAYIKAGVSPSKLVLGIPFYGRRDFESSAGLMNYKDIIKLSKSSGYIIDNWDEKGQVPYVSLNGAFEYGYDNPKSIAIKGQWIMPMGFKGMMFWDYDGDDAKGTLRKACWNAVMKQYK